MLSVVSKVFLILFCIIIAITFFIFIFSKFRFHINSKSKFGSIFIVIIVLSFIIILPIILINSNILENYDNSNTNPNPILNANSNPNLNSISNFKIQQGTGNTDQTGTITFDVPFQNIPKVYTQIIGNQDSMNNVYSIQVFNITNNGFSYSKNMVVNKKTGQFTISTLNPSTTETFDWIAIG